MKTQEIELYIEKIRSGIEVSGTIDNEYVELRYKYFLNSAGYLDGNMESVETISLARSYGELCGRDIETNDYGDWKTNNRKKITDEMYLLIGIIENHIKEKGYLIIE